MQSVPPLPPCSLLRLFFKGMQLPDKDTFSKSDPYLVLYSVVDNGRGGTRLSEVGRTEWINNNLNPVWQTSLQVPYYFEVKQPFQVLVYDYDESTMDSQNDFIGKGEFLLGQVIGSRGSTFTLGLNQGGAVAVTAVEVSQNPLDTVCIGFAGRNMRKMDTFGQSDPYFKLSRLLPSGSGNLLYKSRVQKKTLSPVWEETPTFALDALSGIDPSQKSILFECFDEDTFSDDPMGHFTCSLNELKEHSQDPNKSFMLSRVKKDGTTKTYGEIYIRTFRYRHVPTFAEYLAAGFEINLAVSVDFTGSNGDPRDPRSLHAMNPAQPNHYIRSIMSVGEVLMQYDTDKNVPAFGFGAVLPGTNQVSHFFHLNFQPNPYVREVQGVLQAYQACVPAVRFSGPTNFAPTIRSVTSGAREARGVYTVLLILTDGEITDMDQTLDAIVEADDAPLSIVITGVGYGCDFGLMKVLDGDGQRLRSSRGRVSRRDLVQFVPFRDFEGAPGFALAAEVLREIPTQFVEWTLIAGVPLPQRPPPPAPVVQPLPPPTVAPPPPPYGGPPPPYGAGATATLAPPTYNEPTRRSSQPPEKGSAPLPIPTPPPPASANAGPPPSGSKPSAPVPESTAQDSASGICCVCLTEKAKFACVPCGHVVLCRECGQIIQSQPNKQCPLCRREISMIMEIFS